MVTSAILKAHWAITWATVGTSEAAGESTSHVGVVEPMRITVEPLPQGSRVPREKGGGNKHPA